jgi:hypothetical protein
LGTKAGAVAVSHRAFFLGETRQPLGEGQLWRCALSKATLIYPD